MKHTELLIALQNLIGFVPPAKAFAQVLNFSSEKVFYTRAQRNSNYSDEEIEKIENFYGINLGGANNADCIVIDHIGIRPACGMGTSVIDEPEIKPIKLSNSLITNFLRCSSPDNLKTFTASGDSMEDKIYDGDLLLVDIGRQDVYNSGVYIYSIGADWRCKRLNLKINGDLEIISDNKKYENEVLKPDDDIELIIRGRVIKNLSRGL